MINHAGAGKRILTSRGGAAYVIAITVLLVGITLAIAMLDSSTGYYLGEDSRNQKQAAKNSAEAGIDYVFWRVHYKGLKLPLPTDPSPPSGFTVDAVQEGSADTSTMLVTCTGINGRHRHTTTRTVLGLLPYDYALCTDSKIDTGRALTNTSTPGGIRSNSLIKLDSTSTNIRTGAWSATASITTKGVLTPQYPNSRPIAFPTIDYNSYLLIKRVEFPADKVFPYPYPFFGYSGGGVICVNGKATLSGTYSGNYTLVAKSDIIVNGNLTPADANSHLALITPTNIDPSSLAWTINAVMYCHNSGGNGSVHLHGAGDKYITGSISADTFSTDGNVIFQADTSLNLAVMKQLHLPGL